VPIEADLEPRSGEYRDRLDRVGLAPATLVAAVALPILFLHAAFQPTVGTSLGSTRVDLRLSDLAVLAIAAAAVIVGRGNAAAALREGRLVWLGAGAFLLYIFAASFYPVALHNGYPWRTHLVTAFKYAEYALLAPAAVLLLRRMSDVLVVVWTLVGTSVAATGVAILQFAGVDIFDAWPSGGRQPSFVGVDDLGMLSAASCAVSLAIVALGQRSPADRLLVRVAFVAGGPGMILSGALASVLGAVLAAGAAVVAARLLGLLDFPRLLVIVAMVAVVVVGSVFMRSSALGSFARFAGLGHDQTGGRVESYSHRWVLDYVGLKIFLRHPVLGSGWQSGYDVATYGPVLPAARRRFPTQPPLAFPSPKHPGGIQSAYVEALAELGLVGAALFLAWIAAGVFVAARPFVRRVAAKAAWPQLLGLLWICVALGVWNGLWFIAGIPFDALIWLAFGFSAAPFTSRTTRTR
jgi:hypothetical protein